MTVLGNSDRCVVCGICSLVTVQISDGTLGYCATDWLTVALDNLPPGTTVTWTHDNTGSAPGRGFSAWIEGGTRLRPRKNNASPISYISTVSAKHRG